MGIVCSPHQEPAVTTRVYESSESSDPNMADLGDTDYKTYKVHFKHPRFGSVSIYTMELDCMRTILDLKNDLSEKFNSSSEWQVWEVRGNILDNSSTLSDSGVGENGVIEVSVQTPPS